MKILQLNVWAGRLQGQIIDLLQQEKPDIVCLQEAASVNGKDGGFVGTIAELKKEADLKYDYFSPVFGFKIMRHEADFGNCILSKLPFEKSETIFTRKKYHSNFDFNEDDYNVNNLQHVVIHTASGPLHVLNHHGHHIRQHKNGDIETLRQAILVAEYVQTLRGRVILTGDFNLSPHSQSLEQINKVLTNLCIKFDVKTTRTQLTKKKEVCDYIFVGPEVDVAKFVVSDKLVSDHKALILDFN